MQCSPLVLWANSRGIAYVNFDLSEDEELLKALAERFVANRYGPDGHRIAIAHEIGFLPENWRLLGELGLIAAMFSTDGGGLGIDDTGIAVICEALGRGLVAEPLIENAILAGALFERVAGEPLRDAWIANVVAGSKRIALAHREAAARRNPDWVETRVIRNGSGAVLSGHKSMVVAGDGADGYIVSARTSGTAGDTNGVHLYFVEAAARGLSVTPWRLADGSAAVSLALDAVEVCPEACLAGGLADIAAAQTRANLARAAEALGIMERLFADTRDYLKTRTQFGMPLGRFQALQHRMVAQYAAIEQARALVNLAVMTDPADQAVRSKAVQGARAFIGEASVALGHEMIQFHGGMGVTDELAIGHGHKRLLMLSRWPDDPLAALDAFAGA